jgi:hypothetical protein
MQMQRIYMLIQRENTNEYTHIPVPYPNAPNS